jgi:hypothetical protein
MAWMGEKLILIKFDRKTLRKRCHLKDLGVGGRIILKYF